MSGELTESTMSVPNLVLSDGRTMPQVGFGTFMLHGDVLYEAVTAAIEAGYRHIDTAFCYDNEKDIGRAIQDCIQKGIVSREQLFITTKVWLTYLHPDRVEACFQKSINDLQLDYVDLYLIHAPIPLQQVDEPLFPVDDNGKCIFADINLIDTWRVMEKLADSNKVKSIGVSNFNCNQLQLIIDAARIKPVVNQIEVHIFLTNEELISFCHKMEVAVIGFSPLVNQLWNESMSRGAPSALQHESVKDIAKRHGKTTAQILLRHAIDRNLGVVAASGNPEHIKENLEIFDFHLTPNEVVKLNSFNIDARLFAFEMTTAHKDYPF